MHLIDLYLDLLEKTLTGAILEDVGHIPGEHPVLAVATMRTLACPDGIGQVGLTP